MSIDLTRHVVDVSHSQRPLTVQPDDTYKFELVPVMPPDLLEVAWTLYLSAFQELRTQAAQRHVMHLEEFAVVMADDRVTKVLGFDGPTLMSLATRTVDLHAMPLVSPEYFEANYPAQYRDHSIFYVGFLAVATAYQRSGAFFEILTATLSGVPADGLFCMDICATRASMHMVNAVARVVRRVASPLARAVLLDQQSFYAYELTPGVNGADQQLVPRSRTTD